MFWTKAKELMCCVCACAHACVGVCFSINISLNDVFETSLMNPCLMLFGIFLSLNSIEGSCELHSLATRAAYMIDRQMDGGQTGRWWVETER